MPDMWMDVDTALAEVPVNKVPLIDDTDFKTREESVVYNQAGMDLVWNFVTSAGVMTQTAVTPTTAGVYDWVNQGNGMYSIEIPASGGASINNDAEGYGWFTGFATGILPWSGPVIGFRAAALNDALCDGGDLLDVNTTQVGGTAQTARDLGASVLLSSGTGAGQISLSSGAVLLQATQTGVTIPTVTTLTGHTAQTGDSFARLGAPAGASVSADVAAVKTDTGNLVTRITSTLFSGITSLAEWIGLLAGKQTGNATALTEIKATGAGSGTYDPTTDSTEALRDHVGDGTSLTEAGGTGDHLTALSTAAELAKVPKSDGTATWNSTALASINAEADTAISDAALATAAALATVDNEIAVIDGIVDDLKSGIIYGTAATGTLSATQATTNLTGYADDQLIGRHITVLSGSAEGEQSDITDYANTGGLLTFTAMTVAMANGDTFKIT